jgi:hypothetical protein
MRRGALLMETLISIAIFVAAAGFCVRATSDAVAALDRTEKRLLAADLARSAMAQLQAGTITLADLREGSLYGEDRDDQELVTAGNWRVEAHTRPSIRPTLTVVTLTVEEETTSKYPTRFTLRELVALRETSGEVWLEDDLLRDLPDAPDLPEPAENPERNP